MIDKHSETALHIQLQEILKKQIKEGKLKAGQKIPSERELSDLYDVSRSTSKSAVVALYNEGLVTRVTGKGTFVRTTSNIDSMARDKTYTIGLVLNMSKKVRIPIPQSAVYHYLAQGLQDEIKKFNYHLTVSHVDDEDIAEVELYKKLLKKVDGIIFAELRNNTLLDIVQKTGLPVVVIFPGLNNYNADIVNIDSFDIGMKAVNYLLSLGHKKIGIIKGPNSVLSARERFLGYKQALTHAGIKIDELLISEGNGWQVENGERAMKELLKRDTGMTALFAINDLLAKGAMNIAQKNGISIPGEISIIGCDNTDFTAHTSPPLTTLSIHEDNIVRSAIRILMNKIDFPDEPVTRTIYNADLIVRESCRPLKEKADRKNL